jgi:hypothetical protein
MGLLDCGPRGGEGVAENSVLGIRPGPTVQITTNTRSGRWAPGPQHEPRGGPESQSAHSSRDRPRRGRVARGHGELAVLAASHMAGDRNIVRLVGQDPTGGRVVLHQSSDCLSSLALLQMMRYDRSAKTPPRWATAIASGSGASGPCSTASSASPRTIWSISSIVKPEISIGASAEISS